MKPSPVHLIQLGDWNLIQLEPCSKDSLPSNRYGSDSRLPQFKKEEHVPVLVS